MTRLNELYRCNVCGNITEVLHAGAGQLVCCGQPMELLTEKTEDIGAEKHVPVVEKTESGVRVRIGSIAHPMEATHYIEWIELLADGRAYRKHLKSGDAPEAEFEIAAERMTARAYCNVHGLWKG